jgi:hypothetical protein
MRHMAVKNRGEMEAEEGNHLAACRSPSWKFLTSVRQVPAEEMSSASRRVASSSSLAWCGPSGSTY